MTEQNTQPAGQEMNLDQMLDMARAMGVIKPEMEPILIIARPLIEVQIAKQKKMVADIVELQTRLMKLEKLIVEIAN